MKVLIVEPMKEPYTIEIENSLESLQEVVDGYIETVSPFEDNACIICNEEGKATGLLPNRSLKDKNGRIYDILVGTFLIAGIGKDSFCSLTDEQVETYKSLFQEPEILPFVEAKIIPLFL